jgi:hypothetical protein
MAVLEYVPLPQALVEWCEIIWSGPVGVFDNSHTFKTSSGRTFLLFYA